MPKKSSPHWGSRGRLLSYTRRASSISWSSFVILLSRSCRYRRQSRRASKALSAQDAVVPAGQRSLVNGSWTTLFGGKDSRAEQKRRKNERRKKTGRRLTGADAVDVDQTRGVDEGGDGVQPEVPLGLLIVLRGPHGHEAILVPFTHHVEEVDPGQDVPDAQDAAAAEVLPSQPLDEVQHQLCEVAACVSEQKGWWATVAWFAFLLYLL